MNLLASSHEQDIVIENDEIKLTLTSDAKARSLLHKPSGQECLVEGSNAPVFALTEYRPYDAENMLTYVAKSTTFPANKVVRKGDSLFVNFDRIEYTAVIELNVTPHYIGFNLKRLEYMLEEISQFKRVTEIDEFTILQLPVKKRDVFGEWLNVVWDGDIAVNVIGTSSFTKIDSSDRDNHFLLTAGMESEIKLLDVGAALITTTKNNFLDYLAVLERGTAWDSPISLVTTSLDELNNHPRTEDNLAVIKKWEDARLAGIFTDEQKEILKDPWQEHILLNFNGSHELLPYEQVQNFANNNPDGAAFLFTRNGKTWVVYWHKSGSGKLIIPVSDKYIKVYNNDMKMERKHLKRGVAQTIPIDNRRFIEFDMPENEVINILRHGEITDSRVM